jgi:uncharacterized protein (DUF1697 family)
MLRGINVSGHKKIKMEDLQALFVALGHSDVSTYIQSGNIIFTSPADSPSHLARAIEERIAQDLGFAVTVLLRTKDELAQVIASNPFLRQGTDPAKLHVTFLADAPDPELVRRADEYNAEPDEFRVLGREIYLHCPQGYGRTKVNNAFWERRLGVVATTRNWNTVTRLFQLASG